MLPGSINATLIICFLAAVLEGVDLQSVGVAAPRIGQMLHLTSGMLGTIFGLGTLGLLPGATGGGWLADRVGRKPVLILAMLILGLFSLATATATTFNEFVAVRFLTGIGLGAALPNLIALTAECTSAQFQSVAISIMYAGMPIGGVLAAAAGLAIPAPGNWPVIFYLGGALPLLLIPLIMRFLPQTSVPAGSSALMPPAQAALPRRMTFRKVLFAEGRFSATLLLWASYFFTVLVIYLFLNWLPSLLLRRGLAPAQAGVIQILFNAGGAIGIFAFGFLLDRYTKWVAVVVAYAGTCLALLALIAPSAVPALRVAGALTGFFLLGAQLVLYALAPRYYVASMRGTGVGAAVAIGRLGAAAGPVAAGAILAHGFGTGTVLVAILPCMFVAGLAAAFLARRPGSGHADAEAVVEVS